jgi:hypothetical protein
MGYRSSGQNNLTREHNIARTKASPSTLGILHFGDKRDIFKFKKLVKIQVDIVHRAELKESWLRIYYSPINRY